MQSELWPSFPTWDVESQRHDSLYSRECAAGPLVDVKINKVYLSLFFIENVTMPSSIIASTTYRILFSSVK